MAATGLLSTQIGAAAVSAYAIQLLQRWSKAPWITEHTKGINVAARLVTSVVATLGVSWAWGDISNGGHTLLITIPSAVDLLHAAWHIFVQYAIQHGWGNLLNPNPQVERQS
jgi:hypothetical protein